MIKTNVRRAVTLATVVASAGAVVLLPTMSTAADTTQTQFGTTPVEQPTELKTSTSTGKFYTEDAVLYGPDGKQFIPQGANLGVKGSVDWGGLQEEILADNSWGSGVALNHSAASQEWGFNTIRANLLVTDLRSYGQVTTLGYDGMMAYTDKVVNEYTSKGIVVILEPHDPIAFKDKAQQEHIQGQVEKFYKDAATRYKNNPLVWFGSPNEPDFINQEWVNAMDRFIRVVRAQGNDTIFAVGVPTWGQDLGSNPNFQGAKFSYAADMMPKLQTTAYPLGTGGTTLTGNLLTEQHNYGGLCDAPKYPTAAAIKTYIDKVAAASGVPGGGTPVLFGEFGYDIRNNKPIDPPNPADIWGGTAWGSWTCSYDPEKKASNATLNAAKAYGAGLLFWHGTHGGDGRSLKKNYRPLWYGGAGVGLSEQGTHLWNLTHSPTVELYVTSPVAETLRVSIKGNDKLAEATNKASAGIAKTVVYVDGSVVKTVANENKSTTNDVVEQLPVSAGEHQVKVAVYDTAGNVATKDASVTVGKVEAPAPTPTQTPTVEPTPVPTPTISAPPVPIANPTPTTPTAPVASPTAAWYGNATTFGYNMSNLPAGAKTVISWNKSGVGQSTTTTNKSWWSGTQTGWTTASAKVYSSTGELLYASPVSNPAGVPNVALSSRSATTFGFKANNLPAGAKMVVTWKRGGVAQHTSTSSATFWSGTQAGWNDAQAKVVDSAGKVVATSVVNQP